MWISIPRAAAAQRLVLPLLFFSAVTAAATNSTNVTGTYDFIVVGSGPGGGPLAANLAIAGHSVLLLEAGDDQGDSLEQQVPGFFFEPLHDPDQRWDFFVRHYENDTLQDLYPYTTWLMPNGSYFVGLDPPAGSQRLGVYYPRAGTLGGCSTHNAMAAVWPPNSDWNYIADLTGDTSWNSTHMRTLYERLEHCNYLPNGTAGHGFNGYLGTNQPDPTYYDDQPQAKQMLGYMAASLGKEPNDLFLRNDLNTPDPNRDFTNGLFGFTDHIDAMGRRSSARNYVHTVYTATKSDGSRKYPNFDIALNTLATRVLFDTSAATPRATGVEFLQGQSLYSADPRHSANNTGTRGSFKANNEVIVSGGTFNSPQLLKLSGIGPAAELAAFEIPLIADVPGVGENMQDNYETDIVSHASTDFTTIGVTATCTNGATDDDPCLVLWREGKGPYTQATTNAVLFKTNASDDGEIDLLLWGNPQSFRGYYPLAPGAPGADPANTYSFNMVKIHPRSRKGTVKLRSADPTQTPEINFNLFADGGDEDLEAMWQGIQWAADIFDTTPAPLGPFVEETPCNQTAGGPCTASAAKEDIMTRAWGHHATGSCSIGAADDSMAVLDSKFRVRGVEGLRVVDASVFPRIPGAFPVLPTFIVSQKAAETLLEEYGSA